MIEIREKNVVRLREEAREHRLENRGRCFGGGAPDPLNVHTAKSKGGMGLPDPLGFFDSKDAPPEGPDYLGAARMQGGQNVQSAIAQYLLNNPSQMTPYGTLSSKQTGTFNVPGLAGNPAMDVPTFTSSMDFTPEGQKRFDQEQRIYGTLSNAAEGISGRVGDAYGKPFSASGVDDLQNRTEKAILSRMEPNFIRDEDAMRSRLSNQGIASGSEAYNRDFDAMTRQRNDARQQAVLGGLQARPQAMQEEAYMRSLPLNELNALLTGSQVQAPTFGSPGNQQVMPANIYGATKDQGAYDTDVFNKQQAQPGQQNQQVAGLAMTAAMFF